MERVHGISKVKLGGYTGEEEILENNVNFFIIVKNNSATYQHMIQYLLDIRLRRSCHVIGTL